MKHTHQTIWPLREVPVERDALMPGSRFQHARGPGPRHFLSTKMRVETERRMREWQRWGTLAPEQFFR